jgi:transposase
MAKGRLPMRKSLEILRMHFELNLSQRQIGKSLNISRGGVLHCLERFKTMGLEWPLQKDFTAQEFDELLYGAICSKEMTKPHSLLDLSVLPDWAEVKKQLQGCKYLTIQQLWEEYRQHNPMGIGYSAFCERFAKWKDKQPIYFRNTYKGGEIGFVDYSGDSLKFYPPQCPEGVKTQYFVLCFGASNYCYWEFTRTQNSDDFLNSHERTFAYFDCVPRTVMPDNAKVAIEKAHAYQPTLNYDYDKLSEHYGFGILAARVRKPKDKAKVECHVRLAQRFVLGTLRNRRFASLEELNQAAFSLLEKFNNKIMKGYKKSRKELFLELDKSNALSLPSTLYGPCKHYIDITVDPGYHVKVENCLYSVPYTLRGKKVTVKLTKEIAEVFDGLKSVAVHQRLHIAGTKATNKGHMPESHQRYMSSKDVDLQQWALDVGPQTYALCYSILQKPRHYQQQCKTVLGILQFENRVGKARLEKACELAIQFHHCTYHDVRRILTDNIDQNPPIQVANRAATPQHENLRKQEDFDSIVDEAIIPKTQTNNENDSSDLRHS